MKKLFERNRFGALTLIALFALSCANKDGQFADTGPGTDPYLDTNVPMPDLDPASFPLVRGRVIAPRATLPVSGALVYAASLGKAIPPIPDGVYCDECVDIGKGTPHAFTAPDGMFSIRVPGPGKYQIVTQKGAFRRIREVDVPKEGIDLPKDITTLPHITDVASGDTIPKMLVIRGAYDHIENSLAKMGLYEEVNGVKQFTFEFIQCDIDWANPFNANCTPFKPQDVLKDYNLLSQYQIVFVPCDSDWLDGTFTDPTVKGNLLKWIGAGGRLYATDYQYDIIQQTVPNYIHWEGESAQPGSAELDYSYDVPAIVLDDGLKAWLDFQGLTSFELEANWTIISSLEKLPTPGPDQQSMFDLEPKAWMSGNVPGYGERAMTVSFPFGCGRVLFSTYHTEGDAGAELLPQERALLYIILESAVCVPKPQID